MKALRSFSVFLFAGVCLLLGSCVNSKNPLSDPQKAKADDKLSGVWRKTDENGNVNYYHIGLAGEKFSKGMMRAITTAHNQDGTISEPGDLFFFTSELNGQKYLNIAIVEKDDLAKLKKDGWNAKIVQNYWLLKYSLDGDSLHFWGADNDLLEKAVDAKKIQGEVILQDIGMNVLLTDSTDNLAKFFADPANADIFKKEETYQRVK